MQLLGQANKRHRVILRSPVGVARLGTVENATGQSQGSAGEVRRGLRDEVTVEQGDLQDVESHVLDLRVVGLVEDGHLEEGIHCGVADRPTEGLQNVPLHLNEHVVVVETAAH